VAVAVGGPGGVFVFHAPAAEDELRRAPDQHEGLSKPSV